MPTVEPVTETTALKLHEPYTDIKAELAKLAEENEKAVFDYRDSKGEKMARSHIYRMRNVKSAIEKKRKELKADALAYGRQVDAVAKELTAEVVAMIDVHQEPLDRIAQEEEDRKAKIQEAIDNISQSTINLAQPHTAADAAEAIRCIEAISIDREVFQDRMAEAGALRDECLAEMRAGYAAASKREAEQAELERLRAEKVARERKEREERIAAEAAEKAKREAEERAQREREEAKRKTQAEREAAAQRERDAAERAERAEREAKEAAAKAKADADRRVREAEEAREREAQAERDAQAKREANKKHRAKVISDASIAICHEYRHISREQADGIVDLIAAGKVPHVSITF